MGSVYDIAFSFVCDNPIETDDYTDVAEAFKKVLDLGWTEQEITKQLKPYIGTLTVSKLTGFKKPKNPQNLLSSKCFYYHNKLRCIPPPPMQDWDMNTGEIIDIVHDYYLEMRASFTHLELIEYYNKQLELPYESSSVNRYKGAFDFLIKKYGLDLVLFMIDSTRDFVLAEDMLKPQSPVGIAEYEHIAKERLNLKISENKCTGDDRVVIRERVQPCGDGPQSGGLFQEEYFGYY